MLPKSVDEVINREISHASGDSMFQLVRRKGGQEMAPCEANAENQSENKRKIFDLLEREPDKEELLNFWINFHSHFDYPNFSIFYSKREFCIFFSQTGLDMAKTNIEDVFISLLADRQFLFLEDNEHGNNPEYPPMSEIVRDPKRYEPHGQASVEPCADTMADARMRENAATVLRQGFVPTYAHQRAYNELKHNREDILAALNLRKELIERSKWFLKDGIVEFPAFTVPISKFETDSVLIDIKLSQLFHDFVYAAIHKAYVNRYCDLLDCAQKNSLSAIVSVRKYLEEHSDALLCSALVFWRLFTQETTKLAKGELKDFKFKMSEVKTGRRLTKKTQAPTYRKIDCQIMLFDYLLKLLPPECEHEAQEIAYAKFQFHAFSKYNGYTHFKAKDIKFLSCDIQSRCAYSFDLIPDSRDCVDNLGGTIRRHILRCISNDVRWLTPGLPNDWATNSSILATLLLQDTSHFPKSSSLTNRIHAFLRNKDIKCVETYQNFRGSQSEWIKQLEQWCLDYDLVFDDDIPSSDMVLSNDKMKLLCSRLVLEYMLKEQALQEVRQHLAAVAQRMWGHLLLTEYETFNLNDDF